MTSRVRITDVSPRDGLQAEKAIVPTVDKARLVELVRRANVDEIEVSSFVSPKWVPQLGDASELFELVTHHKGEGACYSALVPNMRGLESAIEVNKRAREQNGIERLIDKVSVFAAASEAFSLKNTNGTIDEVLKRFEDLIPLAHEHGMMVRGYISCIVHCPFDGDVSPVAVGDVASRLLDMGADEIDLGDTIGAATPETIEPVIMEAIDRLEGRATNDFGEPTLTLHLHDTFGHASDCVRMALELGVRSFDGSAGGLGGCPYASTETARAPGNISTMLLNQTIREAGFSTGIDEAALFEASEYAAGLLA